MPKIRFIKEKKEMEVPEGKNLREAAREQGVSVYEGVHKLLNCQVFGLCASCRVRVTKGMENVTPMSWYEKIRLSSPMIKMMYPADEEQLRLSCQISVNGDIEVETSPGANLYGEKFWE